jgi:PleD family two-component response regulator
MNSEEGDALHPLLDPVTFRGRVWTEVSRLQRSGGFLSLLVLGARAFDDRLPTEQMVAEVMARLRRSVRLQDVPGQRGPATLAILMPDTSLADARRAAERLLRVATEGAPLAPRLVAAAGVATVFGEVEGGADALIAATEDALAEAGNGEIVCSRTLSGRPRILVVDDDLVFAQALADAISERGWEGHPCSVSEDARQRVASPSYSGLFVDLVLSGTSGVEILRHALEFHPRRPAALMSGVDSQHDAVAQALELGPVVFVRKPLSSADLESALAMFRELLPGARRLRGEAPAHSRRSQ